MTAIAVGDSFLSAASGFHSVVSVPSITVPFVKQHLTVAAAKVFNLRGGDNAPSVSNPSFDPGSSGFDLNRVLIRLDGLNSYGVVTALLMNAALQIYSSTTNAIVAEDKSEDEKKVDIGYEKRSRKTTKMMMAVQNFIRIAFILTTATSVVSGAYTTVIFSLLGLYSKSALGMGRDRAFLQFFAETADVRRGAFRCFLVCLSSFQISFVLALCLGYDEEAGRVSVVRWFAAATVALLSFFSISSWLSVLGVANRVLYGGG